MDPRKSARNQALTRALAVPIAWLFRLLAATWRERVLGEDPTDRGEPVLAALWHSNCLIAGCVYRDRGFAVPLSMSRDGERVDAVISRLGWAPSPRGSSSKGATTLLRELVRRVRRGQTLGVLPDGPRGPAGHAQPGIVAVASMSGRPIHPAAIGAHPCIRLGSWDRMRIPLPFARVVRVFGEPISVPRHLGDGELEALRRRLEAELDRLTEVAEREVAPR